MGLTALAPSEDENNNLDSQHRPAVLPATFSFSDADYLFLARLPKETIKEQERFFRCFTILIPVLFLDSRSGPGRHQNPETNHQRLLRKLDCSASGQKGVEQVAEGDR